MTAPRLSVAQAMRTTVRPLNPDEVAALARLARTLIPAADDHLAGDEIATFADLLHEALAIVDPRLDVVPALAGRFADVPDDDLFDALRQCSESEPEGFYKLSLVLSGVYLYSPELEETLKYPHPHANRIKVEQVVDELDTGLLNPVMERGPIYVQP